MVLMAKKMDRKMLKLRQLLKAKKVLKFLQIFYLNFRLGAKRVTTDGKQSQLLSRKSLVKLTSRSSQKIQLMELRSMKLWSRLGMTPPVAMQD